MVFIVKLISNNGLIIALILLALITLLSLTPLPNISSLHASDKIQHFSAYALLTLPVVLRFPKYWLWIAIFFISWSGGIELLQPLVNRHADWFDMLANGSGVTCGILLAVTLNRILASREKNQNRK